MITGVLLIAGLAAGDSMPQVTLAQAIERATRLDPNYVQVLGQVSNAEWARRSVRSCRLSRSSRWKRRRRRCQSCRAVTSW